MVAIAARRRFRVHAFVGTLRSVPPIEWAVDIYY